MARDTARVRTSRPAAITVVQLAAPYVSVVVFWLLFHNAWLAILSYHAQMLFWLWRDPPARDELRFNRFIALAIPSALAGPVCYLLLPSITTTPVSAWLSRAGLSGVSLLAMVVYFGVIHPPIEQLYWARLREKTPLAHPLFAGYHVIVLASLLGPIWLGACSVVLLGASVMWQQMHRRGGGILVPIASHVLADAGIVLAAFFLT